MSKYISLYRNKVCLLEKSIKECGLLEEDEDGKIFITINADMPQDEKVYTSIHELVHFIILEWEKRKGKVTCSNKEQVAEETVALIVEGIFSNLIKGVDWFLDGVVLIKSKKRRRKNDREKENVR